MIDFDALSTAQVDALREVVFGGDGQGFYRQTARSLVARGLLIATARTSGGFRWVEYEVPLPVFIRFYAWLARQGRAATV